MLAAFSARFAMILGACAVFAGMLLVWYLHGLQRSKRRLAQRGALDDRAYLGSLPGRAPESVALAVRRAFSRYVEMPVEHLHPTDSLERTLDSTLPFDADLDELRQALRTAVQEVGAEDAVELVGELSTDTLQRGTLAEITAFLHTGRYIYCDCGYDLRGSPERCPECGKPVQVGT